MSLGPADTEADEKRSAPETGVAPVGDLLLAPSAVLEGLPDAVVATARDEKIVFVNALAEALFGYSRLELLGRPVQTLWPERLRQRYMRNVRLYFATEDPLRSPIEAWGLRRDGSEFVGEMSWWIVATNAGPLLLAIGRDITERRDAERRQGAVAELSERALAGADAPSLAAEAVNLIHRTLPVGGAESDSIGPSATPTLADIASSTAPALIGRSIASRMRTPTASAALSSTSSQTPTNSSPPNRAIVSPGRTAIRSRRPNSTNTASPVAWPWRSLTCLKSSMSTNSTAVVPSIRFALASACSRRSCSRVRLASPVSGSWTASWRARSSPRKRSSAVASVLATARTRLTWSSDSSRSGAISKASPVPMPSRRPGSAADPARASCAPPANRTSLLNNADTAAYRAKAAGRGRVELYT